MERLTDVDICSIFSQLSDAVQYVHQRGVVHCAITSHAVQLKSTDCAKLTNFEYATRPEKCVLHVYMEPCLLYPYPPTPTAVTWVGCSAAFVCLSVCLSVCLLFHSISQKPIQLGSPN